MQVDFLALDSARYFGKQQDFVYDDSRFCFAGAAVRTGKTHAAARKALRNIRRGYRDHPEEPLEYWFVAPTYALTAVMKKAFNEVLPMELVDWARQGDKELWRDTTRGGGSLCLLGGRTIHYRSADTPESLVGEKVHGVWWTEIARSKYAAWPNVRGRLSNYSDSWLIGDTSPMGRCWFYVDVWERIKKGEYEGGAAYEWRAVDSPFVPRAEIANARATLPPEFFRRDFEASWETFQGQIFAGFNRIKHMRESCPFKPEQRWLAADLNTTAENPACFVELLFAAPVKRGEFTFTPCYVAREHRIFCGLDFEKYAEALRVRYFADYCSGIVIDPSMHGDFKQMLRARNMAVTLGNNSVLPGIRNIGMHLHRDDQYPMLTLNKTCQHLAGEFEGWSWKRNSAGVTTEEPDKNLLDPHLLDGLRYALMSVRQSLGAAMLSPSQMSGR